MLDFDFITFCYGCGACVNACPRTAIQMIQAADGSYIPEIDDRKCIQCGKCDRVCIHLNSDKYHTQIAQEGCYAAYQLDTGKREKSASGGMFLPLAMEVLKRGGYVCGCVWSEDMTAVHIVSNQLADVERMCNSKYVQSNIGRCLAEIQGLLKTGKPVLFCGTPCQCVACEAVVGNPDNLLKVSLICEGTPTPKVWEKYRNAKEKEYGARLQTVNFRCKEPIGWTLPFYTVTTDCGVVCREMSYKENSYVLAMLQGLTYRNSCYHCAFKGDSGCADIVIGDLWKAEDRLLEKSGNKGLSALIVNTPKGKEWVEQVADEFYMEKYMIETVRKNNPPLVRPAEKNEKRERFFEEIDSIPIEENLNRNITHESGLKTCLTKALIGLGLYRMLWTLVHRLRRRQKRIIDDKENNP